MEVHRILGAGFVESVYEESLAIEQAQVLNYLKSSELNLELLLNFGSSSLEIKRLIDSNP